jgi:hypothetical protein
MKKIKLMGLTLVAGALLTGCSCSKVDENTYVNAVSAYNSSDAISFSRIEIITKEGEDSYTRKKIDAKYVFSSNKEVSKMQYSRIDTVNSNGGASSTSEIAETYYNSETNTIYNYFREGTQQVYRYKESNKAYNAKYNVNACNDLDCYRMIVGNFAPIFALDEVMNFVIKDNDGKGEATFKAVCPSFENCASSSQLIEYNLTIGENGNIESLSYEIVNGDSTHTINYTFYSYGSNNVEVDIPKDLSSYKEKI